MKHAHVLTVVSHNEDRRTLVDLLFHRFMLELRDAGIEARAGTLPLDEDPT